MCRWNIYDIVHRTVIEKLMLRFDEDAKKCKEINALNFAAIITFELG